MGALTLAIATTVLLAAPPRPATADDPKPTRPDPGVGMFEARRAPKTSVGAVGLFDSLLTTTHTVTYFGTRDATPTGVPIGWDPCRPIHYVVNPENEPAGGREALRNAFAQATALTGFVFIEDGETTETFVKGKDRKYQPERYGDRWAPVLVTWQPALTGKDGDAVLGYAGPAAAERPNGDLVWVSGGMRLNADAFGFWHRRNDEQGRSMAQGTVLHEIGHLLGLGHSEYGTDLMYPTVRKSRDTYSKAELEAFTNLSNRPCIPDI